jgi:hypothetical protein
MICPQYVHLYMYHFPEMLKICFSTICRKCQKMSVHILVSTFNNLTKMHHFDGNRVSNLEFCWHYLLNSFSPNLLGMQTNLILTLAFKETRSPPPPPPNGKNRDHSNHSIYFPKKRHFFLPKLAKIAIITLTPGRNAFSSLETASFSFRFQPRLQVFGWGIDFTKLHFGQKPFRVIFQPKRIGQNFSRKQYL